MLKGYMFYDDETANHAQRICSVGYILRNFDGEIVGEPVSQLINPESEFDPYTTKNVHGISAKDVLGCPTFAEFCESTDFLEILQDYVLVAHNATGADLHHIRKSLAAYNLEMPDVSYIDTMAESSNNLSIGSLLQACAHYGIELEAHHNALEDARACMLLFDHLISEFGEATQQIWSPGVSTRKKSRKPRKVSPDGLGFVNGSNQTIGEVLEEFEARGLRANPEEIELTKGLKIVVTGRVPGYKGKSIEETLKSIGSKPSNQVRKSTQLLVIGDNAGQSKISPAIEEGIPVMSVFDLLNLIER